MGPASWSLAACPRPPSVVRCLWCCYQHVSTRSRLSGGASQWRGQECWRGRVPSERAIQLLCTTLVVSVSGVLQLPTAVRERRGRTVCLQPMDEHSRRLTRRR